VTSAGNIHFSLLCKEYVITEYDKSQYCIKLQVLQRSYWKENVVLENLQLTKSQLSDSQIQNTRHTNCLVRKELTSKSTTAHDHEPVAYSSKCFNLFP
jgi:hypothetical protein